MDNRAEGLVPVFSLNKFVQVENLEFLDEVTKDVNLFRFSSHSPDDRIRALTRISVWPIHRDTRFKERYFEISEQLRPVFFCKENELDRLKVCDCAAYHML